MSLKSATIASSLALVAAGSAVGADFGKLTQEGEKPVVLTHAVACTPRWDMGFGKHELEVLLSDKELDPVAIGAAVVCDTPAFNQAVHKGHGVLLRLAFDSGLKLARVSIYGVGFTLGDDKCDGCKAAVAYAGDNVKGTVATTQPLDLSSTKFTFDTRFDLPKPGAPPAGTPLPAGGGDPGKAVAAWVKAYQDGDYATLVKVLPPGEAEDKWGYYEESERKGAIQSDADMQPKTAKVLEGWSLGDRALLVVEVPALWGGKNQKAAIGLSKADGTWRVDEFSRDLSGTMFGER
jgi:hypothetical protein